MPKLFYLASAIGNIDKARQLIRELGEQGWTCTYDWTGDWSEENEASFEAKQCIALTELAGVMDCDVFALLLPGGRGAHVELGVALASGKPVLLMYTSDSDLAGSYAYTCIFYFAEDVTRYKYPGGQPDAAAVALALDKLYDIAQQEVADWAADWAAEEG